MLDMRHTVSMSTTGKHDQMPRDEKAFDVDTGRTTMKLTTLVTLIVGLISAVVAGVVGVVTWQVNTATKDDVAAIMVKHSNAPHHVEGKAVSAPADIVPIVEANARAVTALVADSKTLHKKVDAQAEQTQYINSRLEFLVEREVNEAQGNSEARSNIRRAARKVRARRAPGSVSLADDPLAGL